MKELKKGFKIFIIFWLVLLNGLTELNADRRKQIEQDIIHKKKDLKDIKKEISIFKEKEKRIEGKEISVLETLNLLETELNKKERELKRVEDQLVRTREKILNTKYQISDLNQKIEQTKEELFSRLNGLYKLRRIPPETFIFTSQSFHDLLRIEKYFRVILDSDTKLIETYRDQIALKVRFQNELLKDEKLLEEKILQVEQKRNEVKEAKGSKRKLLRKIQNQKLAYRKLIAKLEERGKRLQILIDNLERERRMLAYKAPKIDSIKGRIIPPVNGKVISFFKERGQNGIEIQAPLGAEVRAVLPGRIIYADWFKGFGNLVIIDHGNHTFTVSGYLSRLLKKAGEEVSKGEIIALVGSQGSLKGPCLYFEIRKNGKPQDPMQWISPMEKGLGSRDKR